MKTRLLIFAKQKQRNNQFICMFAMLPQGLQADIGIDTLAEFAFKNNLTRHDTFDWTVGDGGASCAMFEAVNPSELAFVESSLPSQLDVAGTKTTVEWLAFAGASKHLTDKDDRRYLLLAVQFVAAGSKVQDDLLASPVDQELLNMVEENIVEPLN